jgi:hypothetical protein
MRFYDGLSLPSTIYASDVPFIFTSFFSQMLEDNTLYFFVLQEPFYRKDIPDRITAVRIERITDLSAVN